MASSTSKRRQRITYLQECIREMEEEIRQIEEDIEENGDDPIKEDINESDHEQISLADNHMPNMDVNYIVKAESVERYYYVGDFGPIEPYCKIKYLGDHLCSRMFFGVLLGFTDDNTLGFRHIDAWITRALLYLERQRKRNRPIEWTIMPTNFNASLVFPFGDEILNYGNGKLTPYPALWKVKNVLIPIRFRLDYWCLLHLDLRTHVYQLYDTNLSFITEQERDWVFIEYEKLFTTYLIHTKYWPRGERLDGNPTFKFANITQCLSTVEDSGVFVCMFIQNLISGKPMTFKEGTNYKDLVSEFRLNMARKLYAARV